MRTVQRLTIKSKCNCQKEQIMLEFNFSLDFIYLSYFKDNNFKNNEKYAKSGIFFLENEKLVAIGPVGRNQLQIKCKTAECDKAVEELENLIRSCPNAEELKLQQANCKEVSV